MSTIHGATAKLLTKSLEELRSRGWHQGSIEAEDGSVCAIGALSRAATGVAPFLAQHARHCLTAQLPEMTVAAGLPGLVIVRYNDLPTTTQEDIELLFKSAIAAEEEKAEGKV